MEWNKRQVGFIGLPIFSGLSLRLLAFVLIYILLFGFIYLHAKRIAKPVKDDSFNSNPVGAKNALDVMYENLTSAHSNLVDADVAQESSEYTKQYILQQTATSLLAQANQIPSLALSLI